MAKKPQREKTSSASAIVSNGRPEVVLDPGAAENGLANMLADLMRQNMEASPHKARCFKYLSGIIAVEATDAEVSLTMVFTGGRCVIYDGIAYEPDVMIRADSESILELSMVRLVFGLPFFLDLTGLSILSKSLTGRIRMSGALLHPLNLALLTIVLSVN